MGRVTHLHRDGVVALIADPEAACDWVEAHETLMQGQVRRSSATCATAWAR